MQRILVLGAGFSGLWAAAAAARARHAARLESRDIEIVVIDKRPYHSIRVRNYEVELADTLIPLQSVFDPIGVRHLPGEITTIDAATRTIGYSADGAARTITYDRLVCALGSELVRPPIPGLAEYGFDIDTFPAAEKLGQHIAALPARAPAEGQFTVLVVGAGLTGIEVAAEMPARTPRGHRPRSQSRRRQAPHHPGRPRRLDRSGDGRRTTRHPRGVARPRG